MLKSIIDNMNGKLNVNYTYAFWINSFCSWKNIWITVLWLATFKILWLCSYTFFDELVLIFHDLHAIYNNKDIWISQ